MSLEDNGGCIGIIIAGLVVVAIAGGMVGCPTYNVYEHQKRGEAELAQADSNRKIATLEASAKMESAKMLAEAEIIRARGVAEANRIIGDSLKGNEAYLHYLWIHNLAETKNEVIYIPTEANMPIMESGRVSNRSKVQAEK